MIYITSQFIQTIKYYKKITPANKKLEKVYINPWKLYNLVL